MRFFGMELSSENIILLHNGRKFFLIVIAKSGNRVSFRVRRSVRMDEIKKRLIADSFQKNTFIFSTNLKLIPTDMRNFKILSVKFSDFSFDISQTFDPFFLVPWAISSEDSKRI